MLFGYECGVGPKKLARATKWRGWKQPSDPRHNREATAAMLGADSIGESSARQPYAQSSGPFHSRAGLETAISLAQFYLARAGRAADKLK
jgi:hypothetical protein